MDTGQSVALTAVIVVAGKWVTGEKLEAKFAIGVAAASIFLSILAQSNPQLGSQFATLILVTAALIYIVPIAKKLGYTKG